MPGAGRHGGGPDRGLQHHRHRGRRHHGGAPRQPGHGPGSRGQRHDLPGGRGICSVARPDRSDRCRDWERFGVQPAVPRVGQRRARRWRRPLRRQRLPGDRVRIQLLGARTAPTRRPTSSTRAGRRSDHLGQQDAGRREPRRHLHGRGPRHRHRTAVPRAVPLDNGPDSDVLYPRRAAWPGDLAIDNAARRASVGDRTTALSWTAVDSFSTRVHPASSRLLPRNQRGRAAQRLTARSSTWPRPHRS